MGKLEVVMMEDGRALALQYVRQGHQKLARDERAC